MGAQSRVQGLGLRVQRLHVLVHRNPKKAYVCTAWVQGAFGGGGVAASTTKLKHKYEGPYWL